MKCFQQIILCLFITMLCFQSQAANNLKFSGTLIEPPGCKINGGDKIDVDFKQVGVNKVDGVNNQVIINYKVICDPNTSAASNWDMRLEIIGTAIDYDRAAIKTDVTDLGIRIYQNDKPFELNRSIAVNAGKPIVLKAVPVKKPGSTLKPEPFSAAATLLAVYQ